MSNKNRLFTILLGATALAGLTYGATRRGLQRRAVQPATSQTLPDSALTRSSAPVADAAPASAADEPTLDVQSTRGSTPDPLDIAISLDGIFDGQADGERALTARLTEHLPAPYGGDDNEAPNADDLGLAWLSQATQAELSLTESDLRPELEALALVDEGESDEASSDEAIATNEFDDEHEDFRRTRA